MFSSDKKLVDCYFDHGATSFPKPVTVMAAMTRSLEQGGTYGRSAYKQAQDASRMVFETRETFAEFVGALDSSRIVFAANATIALNIAIQGVVKPRTTVLISPLEHNSVMRPLEHLRKTQGIKVKVMPADLDGRVDVSKLAASDDVCLAVCQFQSNVNGVCQPIAQIKQKLGSIPLLVDAAQGAGERPLDVNMADMFAFTGHKGLLGPTGTGALYVREGLEVLPLLPGGTGSRSESIEQPTTMPDALESGTPNLVGIAGLGASLRFLQTYGVKDHSTLALVAIERLEQMKTVTVFKAQNPDNQGPLFSFAVDGISSSTLATQLFARHAIAIRPGLHCAPCAHRHLNSFEAGGTCRIAFGYFHDAKAVDRIVDAIKDVIQ